MRKAEARTTLLGIITSKRIAVALCAAIAMVLGAMSVGASYRSGTPTATAPESVDGQFAALEDTNPIKISSPKTNSGPLAKDLSTEQQTLVPNTAALSQPTMPILTGPAANTTPPVQLNLGSINASVTPQNINLTLETPATTPADVSVPVPEATPVPTTATDTSSQTIPVVKDVPDSTLSTPNIQTQN